MKHLQDLPNIEGFRFVGITHDNERKECFVAKDLMGCHTIKGEATWFDLDGWEDAPPKQLKAEIAAVANTIIECEAGSVTVDFAALKRHLLRLSAI